MAFLLYLLSALSLGVTTNGISVLAAGAVFLLLQKRTGTKRALSYACVFLAGAAVAKLQWMIFTDRDPSEVGFQIWATVALVGAVTVTGLVASWRFLRVDKILIVFVAMSVIFHDALGPITDR